MLVAILLATATIDRPHVGIAAGGGVAFGIIGAHLEGRIGPFAAFAGLGMDAVSHNYAHPATFVAGARWFFGDGDGVMLSAQLAKSSASAAWNFGGEGDNFDNLFIASTVGWRARSPHGFFYEAGIGFAMLRQKDFGVLPLGTGEKSGCTPDHPQDQAYCVLRWKPRPDLDLAIGFEF